MRASNGEVIPHSDSEADGVSPLPLLNEVNVALQKDIQDHFSVPQYTGVIRAPSPDTLSNLSVEDYNALRTGRAIELLHYPDHQGQTHASRSPAPPLSLKKKIQNAWIRNKGLCLVLIAQLFGTLMNVTTRLLELEGNNGKGMHPFHILFARMSITVVLASTYMWFTKIEHFPFGMREIRLLLVARGIGGFFGVFGLYYSLMYLPLADATVLTFLAPSLACWACSFLINEPFTRMEQIAAYISLFGVVLIARPTLSFSRQVSTPPTSGDADIAPISGAPNSTTSPHDRFNYDNVTPAQRAGAVGLAMLGVLGAACAYTTIRWIGKRAHPLLSVNYFAVWCTIVATVMMFALPDIGFLLPANMKEWALLIFLGVCGFVMQFLLAAGLQYEKSSRATNMVYTQMLFALAFDKLVFGTTPELLSIIGSSLILGSAIYVAVHKDSAVSKETTEGRGTGRDEERGLVEVMEDNSSLGLDQGRRGLQEVQLRTLRV
ncbi:hypothetical protein M501DRAFT_930558 [Patellaria atrata CBS 101060]|uniref:EamA domain-containing protein n=1 Tax=Patellaria atrata CBS 101060 TaxID=1346257 RepID=A0A9P4VSV6_9PEZI|nr:hypothetical protein M501DRAFT_930558 [Patellaria atrata CBS 101060]